MALKLTKDSAALKLTKSDGSSLTRVNMGLGWSPAVKSTGGGFFGKLFGGGSSEKAQAIDLDASVIVFDANKRVLETVYFGRKTGAAGAILHSGDNRTGEGDGDDEVISIDLEKLNPSVHSLVFVINSYSGQLFSSLSEAYCRVVDVTGRSEVEHSRYVLSDGQAVTGYIMAKVFRDAEGWQIKTIGEPANGRVATDVEGIASRYA